MKKRLVSMILSAVLFATSVPVTAFAEDANAQNPVAQSEEGTSQGKDKVPETGDSSPIALYLVLAVIAAMSGALVVRRKNK